METIYGDIIAKLSRQINRPEQIFVPLGFGEISTLKDLSAMFGAFSSVYSEEELDVLKQYHLPPVILEFYKNYSPSETIMLAGGVRLLSFQALREENLHNAPGAFLLKFGVVTFATTIGGDALCFDLNNLKNGDAVILLADHTIFSNRMIRIFTGDKLEKFELSYEVIRRYTKKAAPGLINFLEKAADGRLVDVEGI